MPISGLENGRTFFSLVRASCKCLTHRSPALSKRPCLNFSDFVTSLSETGRYYESGGGEHAGRQFLPNVEKENHDAIREILKGIQQLE